MNKNNLYKKSYVFGGNVKHYIKSFSKKDESGKDVDIKVNISGLKTISIEKRPSVKPNLNQNSKSKFKLNLSSKVLIGMMMLLVFVGTFLGSYVYFKSQQEGLTFTQSLKTTVISSVKSLNDVVEPQILKYEDRYTTFLLLGVDSRAPVIENGYIRSESGFEDVNTDTIMQIVYDHQENNFYMISIPRDLGHSYKDDPCLDQYRNFHPRNSINHVYKFGYMGECPGGGIGMLKKYIQDVTGFPVHYYAMVNLDSFLDVIDIVGDEVGGKKGLYIDVPEAVSSWYPNEYTKGYNQVYIPSGYNFLTSQEVLYYSRVRIGYDDYHRARRQQIVIDTLKTKLLSNNSFDDPLVLGKLIDKFKDKMVFSELNLDELRAVIELYSNLSSAKVYKIVLDNKLGSLNEILMAPKYSSDGNHNVNGWYLIPATWEDKSIDDKFIFVKNYIMNFIENNNEFRNLELN